MKVEDVINIKVFRSGNDIEEFHVYPLGDTSKHFLSRFCRCHPQRDSEDPDVIIHNAFDNREITERSQDN